MARHKPVTREEAKPQRPSRDGPLEPPPTIDDLKAVGLTGALVTCGQVNCQRSKAVAWADLSLPDETLFPEIRERKAFRCSACGSRAVSLMPDWRGYRAAGGGE